jgi:anti-sigma B factor antagonist
LDSAIEITVVQENGRVPVTVFEVRGDIDSYTYEALQARFEQARSAGMRHLLLDLSGVNYVGSAGLRVFHHVAGVLRSIDETAPENGLTGGSFKSSHFKLLNPSRDVAHMLNATGFDLFLEIYRDRQTAVASF